MDKIIYFVIKWLQSVFLDGQKMHWGEQDDPNSIREELRVIEFLGELFVK